jgi:23S rRNA pseudoU1915 N3-methylase RlmH
MAKTKETMTKEWQNYLERLMKAMNLTEIDLEEFDAMIQQDYKTFKKEVRKEQGEEILKKNKII